MITQGKRIKENGIISNGNHVICSMNDIGGNVEDDARLIVAAPELLKALKLASELCDLREMVDANTTVQELVDRAIAKAEGK